MRLMLLNRNVLALPIERKVILLRGIPGVTGGRCACDRVVPEFFLIEVGRVWAGMAGDEIPPPVQR